MNIKKQWVKPVMVTEQFSADQYVAICAESPQYLYVDSGHMEKVLGADSFLSGADHYFQDKTDTGSWSWLHALWVLILAIFTGRNYTTDGEFSGIQTISNPTVKGTPFSFQGMTNYPVYGSGSKLDNGDYYPGTDLRGRMKITPNKDIYIQGNMS